MTVVRISAPTVEFIGLSTDAKPVDPGVHAGNTFLELDSARTYIADGLGNWWSTAVAQGYSLIKVTEVLSGTSYTYTTGAKALFVEAIGGGGAGGSVATAVTNSGAAGGGGGGAYAAKWITALKAAPYTVAIGAGGTPGGAGANPGGPGGDTTFDTTTVVAKGGAGGIQDTIAAIHVGGLGGAGGLASGSTGDMVSNGEPGTSGLALAAAQAVSGSGGNSVLGGGANGRVTQGDGAAAANNTGGGGSGGCSVSGGASQNGGAGGTGLLRIWEFA